MWILLEPGDRIKPGDEFYRDKTSSWEPMSPHTWDFGSKVVEGQPPMRRRDSEYSIRKLVRGD